jgi:hypothetical protein
MMKEPAKGGLSFPEAAKRYGDPQLSEAFRLARERLPADWSDEGRFVYASGEEQAYLRAKKALFSDYANRLAKGERTSFGTAYQAGSPSEHRDQIERGRWRFFEAELGTAVRLGPQEAPVVVRDVLIYLRSAERNSVTKRKSTPRTRGRPRGSGSYALADAPLLQQMKELIETGQASSVNVAASLVADKAKGPGTLESKLTRLRHRYVEKYGN